MNHTFFLFVYDIFIAKVNLTDFGFFWIELAIYDIVIVFMILLGMTPTVSYK